MQRSNFWSSLDSKVSSYDRLEFPKSNM